MSETYSMSQVAAAIGVTPSSYNRMLRQRRIMPEPAVRVGSVMKYSFDQLQDILVRAAGLKAMGTFKAKRGRPCLGKQSEEQITVN